MSETQTQQLTQNSESSPDCKKVISFENMNSAIETTDAIQSCATEDDSECSVVPGVNILRSDEGKSKHCVCYPQSCNQQQNPGDPESVDLQEPPVSEEQLLVKELINAVITRASKEAKVSPSEMIQQRLFTALWAQVEQKPLKITHRGIKKLEKVIFKDITKRLDISPDLVIIALAVGQPYLEVIISIFEDHLFRKKSLLARFFSWCVRAEDDEDEQTKAMSETRLEEFKSNIFRILEKKSSSGISVSDYDDDEEEHVSALIDAVLTRAANKSHYRPSKKLHRYLLKHVLSDNRIKDLHIHEKKLKDLDRAIYQELRQKTFCKEKHLLMLLNDEDPVLRKLTVDIIKNHLIDTMQNPALCDAEEAENYRLSVEACIKKVVTRVNKNASSPSSTEKVDAITQRLFIKLWPRLKKIKVDNVMFISDMVYSSLIQKWKEPDVILTFMELDHEYADDIIIKVFKEHAITVLESEHFMTSFFLCAGHAVWIAGRKYLVTVM
ncbi:uncharacterized protein LOC113021890 [Astatotilapia calliptera]|uniref:uncharacterized protein LOC113021890 n=1 Tax=Astatotilapia calliptera TaxID=8154 RepID=UPI000E42AF9C|nr:uncharacterized protein LOC113021890 [Astatotilapia calliptera]